MRIITVRYRRLESTPHGFGHNAVEAEAEVGEDQEPAEAFEELKSWVLRRLESIREVDHHLDNLERLRGDVRASENRLEGLQSEITRAREIIRQHDKLSEIARREGLDAQADELGDNVPF